MITLEPRIYAACLSSYSNGILYGAWIDANQDADAIQDEINTMLANSPMPGAEEWAIHDFEDFGSIRLSEHEGVESVAEIASFIMEHGELGAELYTYFGEDLETAKQYLEEAYCGEYDSEEDYAEHIASEIYEIPEHLEFYIDYERMARDLFINDYLSISVGGSVHVFHYL